MREPMDLDDIAKRPARYWNQDGLSELFVGLMILVPMCLFFLGDKLPKGSRLLLFIPLAWGATVFVVKWALKELKERVVSPRGGYVALREPRKAMRVGTAVLLAGLVATVGITFPLAIVSEQWGKIAGLALALFFATCFFLGRLQAKLPHMLVLAGVPLLVSVWIYRDGLGLRESIFLLLLAQGGALAFSGSLRLTSFLKAHPRVDIGA